MPLTRRQYYGGPDGWLDWSGPLSAVYGGGDNIPSEPAGIGIPSEAVLIFGGDQSGVQFTQAVDGEDPYSPDNLLCPFAGARLGLTGDQTWGGFCPPPTSQGTFLPDDSDPADYDDGTGYVIGGHSFVPPTTPGEVHAGAQIGGWAIYPWRFYDGLEVMGFLVGDPRLAYAEANLPPGDGWDVFQTEFEEPYCTLVGIDIAPDEAVISGGSYDGAVHWKDSRGTLPNWYFGHDDAGALAFLGPGVPPFGDMVYDGGLYDWTPVDWLPDQDLATGAFVTPADEDAAAVPYTLAHDALVQDSGSPPGRTRNHQTLAYRFTYQPPRLRFYRDIPYSPAPRRVIGRQGDGLVGGGRRVIGGRSTRQNGNRTIGRTI